MTRPSRDGVLMATATAFEELSTCARNHVGAVIAIDGRIIGTGYNGAPAGMPHCEHSSAMLLPLRATPPGVQLLKGVDPNTGCKVAIHAESNAIAYAARHGVSVKGATLYVTLSPCYGCAQLVIAAGLTRVVFDRGYRDISGIDLLREAGLEVTCLREVNPK